MVMLMQANVCGNPSSTCPLEKGEANMKLADATTRWLVFNTLMLGCYLGFFHLVQHVPFPASAIVGVLFTHGMIATSYLFQDVFLNRWEVAFYLILPLDIALESLVPIHQGYSFYFCATAFWCVFLGYRYHLRVAEHRKHGVPIRAAS